MAGSIRQRSPGVWELRVYIGRDRTGRVRHKYATFEGTKRTAERELARLVTQQEDQPARIPEKEERTWGPATTINDAIEGWKQNGWQDLSPPSGDTKESGGATCATPSEGGGSPRSLPTTSSATSVT
jgi:hypothetical protein